jgi:hypothetical protein
MARRPGQLPPRTPVTPLQVGIATYVGSAEHKQRRWWGGLPAAYVGPDCVATRPKKQTTTIFPLVSEADHGISTKWVREALSLGQFRYYEADQGCPNHIWYRDENGQS